MSTADRTATYFDGKSAGKQQVVFDTWQDRDGLTISTREGDVISIWKFENIRLAKDSGSAAHPVLSRYVDGAEERLVLDNAADLETLRQAAPDLMKTDVKAGTYGKIVKWGAGAAAALCLMIFVIIPALANTLATFIPPEREAAVGRSVLGQIEWALKEDEENDWVCANPEGQAALEKMMATLMGARETPYDLDVRVVSHPMVNAFAVPGGHMVFMYGLIEQAESPEEVAAVFAHELGHVVARDPMRGALRAAGSAGLLSLALGDATGGTIIAVAADQALSSSFTRDAEANADRFAYQMLIEAEVPPSALSLMFKRLKDEYGDVEGIAEHFSSHPALGDRIQAAVDATPEGFEGTPILTETEWAALRRICE